MFARIPSVLLPRQGRLLLLSALAGLVLVPSCTKSEDTEPYIPASEGAKQPSGGGALLSEEEACGRLRDAAVAAEKRLRCDNPDPAECPGFLRPGGGSGCYEYSQGSITACEKSYEAATTCRALVPCIATAVRNDELETCELNVGQGGAGGMGATSPGGAPSGGTGEGGMGPVPVVGGAGAANAGAPAAGAATGGVAG